MIQFEIKRPDGDVEFVQVLEVFVHHYTGEMMRRVRIDGLVPFSTNAYTRIEIFNEEQFNALLERSIN